MLNKVFCQYLRDTQNITNVRGAYGAADYTTQTANIIMLALHMRGRLRLDIYIYDIWNLQMKHSCSPQDNSKHSNS